MSTITLSSEYESLFNELLEQGATWKPHRGLTPDLTACWTACGDSYAPDTGMLVLGRATNGFWPDMTTEQLGSAASRRELIPQIREMAEKPGGGAPLSWVEELGDVAPGTPHKRALGGTVGSRSPFWRVARSLLNEMNPDLPANGWSSHLAWGNLYKLAPNVTGRVSEGANPGSGLMCCQRAHCVDLLRRELLELRPRVVLVIAGKDWYRPFVDALDLKLDQRPTSTFVTDTAVETSGRIWIFTNRPERRKQSVCLDDLLSAFRDVYSRRTWSVGMNAL